MDFYRFTLKCPKLGRGALLRDILFYDGERQIVMDTRGQADYAPSVGMARVLDGDPRTAMDTATGSGLDVTVDLRLGETATHLVVVTPDASLLAGATLEFWNIRRRPILKLDLGDLARLGKADAYRVELPSLKTAPVAEVPRGTHYVDWDPGKGFADGALVCRFGEKADLGRFRADDTWVVTERGVYPHFVGVSSPSPGDSAEGIERTVDGNPGTKWCRYLRGGLVWEAQVAKPVVVSEYTFVSANDVPKRDPKEWDVLGSTDGREWTVLDSRRNEPLFTKRFQARTFRFANAKAYSSYRIHFKRNHGDGLFQLGEIRLGDLELAAGKQEGRLILKDGGLAPGESVAVTFDHGFLTAEPRLRYGIRLGGRALTLERYDLLTDPIGKVWRAKRAKGPDRVRQTLLLTRRAGPDASRIVWRVLGIRHDCEGEATLPGAAGGELPVEVFVTPMGGTNDRVDIACFALGKLARPLPELAKAEPFVELDAPSVRSWTRHVRADLKGKGVQLPKVGLKEPYGPLKKEELEFFRKTMRTYPVPKSNRGNAIMFGAQQSARGLYHVLKASDDEELFGTLETWCDSILEYRNGGPHYTVNYLPIYISNPGLEPGELLPIWPHFMSHTFIGGKVHYMGDLSAGCSAPSVLAMYADYVTSRPDTWKQRCASGDVTRIEKAKQLAREAERTLSEFTIKYFADPETGRIEKPWNRYAALIEACVMLEDIHERLKDHPDFFSRERQATYHRVVRGFLGYFFDAKENYSEWWIRREGRPLPVMDYRYAPRYLGWGSYSEGFGYSCLDFVALLDAYVSGRYSDVISDARVAIIGNTLRNLTYKGRNDRGEMLHSTHIRGDYGGVPGSWGTGHMLVALVDPSFYDEFIGDMLKAQDEVAGFGHLLWIRELLHERGLGAPAERTAPKPVIRAEAFRVGPPYRVVLTAELERGDKAGARYEWDLDRDGKPEHTGRTMEHTFTRPGNHFVLLRVTDAKGRTGFAQATVIVSPLGPGKGAGKITGAGWKGIGGDGIAALTGDARFPNSPDERFEAKALELPRGFGDAYGTMMEGYLHPPADAGYTFYIASDDQSELWLSPDADPARAVRVASVPDYTGKGEWTKSDSQRSRPVALAKDRKYYFRVLHKEGSGGDHVSVAWRIDGMDKPELVEGEYLSPVR
ncbi:MAG: PA14 domain-containing protein [Planctomycetota bacterium]|jgi:hypothetical protein